METLGIAIVIIGVLVYFAFQMKLIKKIIAKIFGIKQCKCK
jgi:multisubunit Na+/H+ antiporter MnhG subunit